MPTQRRANGRQRNRPIVVLRQFRLIFGSIRQHFRQVEEKCGVSGSQLWILREVCKTPGVGVTEVAARLSIHQSTCSQLVEKLVQRKLLRKSRPPTGDQRRIGLYASKVGERCIAAAPRPTQGILPEALTNLPDPVLKSLERNLARVIAELDIKDPLDADRPLADM